MLNTMTHNLIPFILHIKIIKIWVHYKKKLKGNSSEIKMCHDLRLTLTSLTIKCDIKIVINYYEIHLENISELSEIDWNSLILITNFGTGNCLVLYLKFMIKDRKKNVSVEIKNHKI
jgi:hypothetical protein